MKKKQVLILKLIIGILSIGIVVVSLVLFLPRMAGNKRNEEDIVRHIDFADTEWITDLVELDMQLYKSDFLVYSACAYTEDSMHLRVIYSTTADIRTLRGHYKSVLIDAQETDVNDEGNLALQGTVNGKKVAIKNYYSEVANIIEVKIEFTGDNADIVRKKLTEAFPEAELTQCDAIFNFCKGNPTGGYVLYNYDEYSFEQYSKIPIFSKAYVYDGTEAAFKKQLGELSRIYTNNTSAIIDENIAYIKEHGYIYSVSLSNSDGQMLVVVTLQKIPSD